MKENPKKRKAPKGVKAGTILDWQGKFKGKPRKEEQALMLDGVAEHVRVLPAKAYRGVDKGINTDVPREKKDREL